MEIAIKSLTKDVDPSAEYRFRKVETEMDNCEIPEITKKQIENIHRRIK